MGFSYLRIRKPLPVLVGVYLTTIVWEMGNHFVIWQVESKHGMNNFVRNTTYGLRTFVVLPKTSWSLQYVFTGIMLQRLTDC